MTKQDELVQYLVDHPGPHTAKELAIAINRSPRTIKSYIRQLPERYHIQATHHGYVIKEISENVHFKANNKSKNASRSTIVINKLLASTKPLNIYDLSAQLYLSESSLIEVFNQVKRELGKFGLKAVRNGDYISIEGSESDRRHLISGKVYDEISGNFLNETMIKKNFPSIDISSLSKTINAVAMKNNLYLNTFDKNDIILHLAIAIERQNQGHTIGNVIKGKYAKTDSFANQLLDQVQKNLNNVQFTLNDREDLVMLIDSSVSRKQNQTSNLISPETKELLKTIIEYLKKIYDFDLSQSILINQFSIHLDRLIKRLKSGKTIHNPLAVAIKSSNPTIYECATLIGHLISDRIQKPVPDHEIGFIAMHIGNALSEQIAAAHMIKAILFAPNYQNQISTITGQINKHFSDTLIIYNVVDDASQLDDLHYDLLICVGSYTETKQESIMISPFVNFNDINLLQQKITDIRHRKTKEVFKKELNTFFTPKLFYFGRKITSREQAFRVIVDGLTQENAVGPDYLDKLLQREKMSSTSFGKVAIPHSFNMTAEKSRGYVIINPSGIQWDSDNKVYIVIALAIDTNNKSLFRQIFDHISEIMVDDNNISKLVQCENYGDFIDKLIELI